MDSLSALFADLRSPDPDLRFAVLNRMEAFSWNEEQRQALRDLIAKETDSGMRLQMESLLERVSRVSRHKTEQAPISPENLDDLLRNPQANKAALVAFLEGVSRRHAVPVAVALRRISLLHYPVEVLPSIIKFFQLFGNKEDALLLEPYCRHDDVRVLGSAIEALEKLDPERLKQYLVPLLLNQSYGIRSRAIRVLYRWDAREALRHFEAMLFSEDQNDRQAALFHAFFFPFSDIEPFMLKFLGLESDPDQIVRAGFIFRANPTPEIPLRLLEARDASVGDKRRLINDILNGVIDSLHKAGLIEKQPEQIFIELESVYQQRKAHQLIARCRLALGSENPQTRLAAAVRLGDFFRLGFPGAKEDLLKFIAVEKDATISQQIRARLPELAKILRTRTAPGAGSEAGGVIPQQFSPSQSATTTATIPALPADRPAHDRPAHDRPAHDRPAHDRPAHDQPAHDRPTHDEQATSSTTPPSTIAPPTITPLCDAPPEERLLRLAQTDAQTWRDDVRPHLKRLLSQAPTEEKVTLLQMLHRFGNRQDASIFQATLNDSDPRVLAMALDTFAQVDADVLVPLLPRFIQHPNDDVRSTAVKVFALFDKKQALALVEKMLYAVKPLQRGAAIFSMGQFDFPSIKEMLLATLQREPDPDNIRQICAIFQANPEEQIFFEIYSRLDKTASDKKEILRVFLKDLAQALIDENLTNCSSIKELEAVAEKKALEEAEQGHKKQPSYSLANIRDMRARKMAGAQAEEEDRSSLVRFAIVAFAVGALLTMVIWHFFLAPTSSPEPGVARRPQPKRSSSSELRARNVTGVVKEIRNAGRQFVVTVQDAEQSTIIVDLAENQLMELVIGGKFRGQIKPSKIEGDTIFAELIMAY